MNDPTQASARPSEGAGLMTLRSECRCPCHANRGAMFHCVPCCRPDPIPSEAADARAAPSFDVAEASRAPRELLEARFGPHPPTPVAIGVDWEAKYREAQEADQAIGIEVVELDKECDIWRARYLDAMEQHGWDRSKLDAESPRLNAQKEDPRAAAGEGDDDLGVVDRIELLRVCADREQWQKRAERAEAELRDIRNAIEPAFDQAMTTAQHVGYIYDEKTRAETRVAELTGVLKQIAEPTGMNVHRALQDIRSRALIAVGALDAHVALGAFEQPTQQRESPRREADAKCAKCKGSGWMTVTHSLDVCDACAGKGEQPAPRRECARCGGTGLVEVEGETGRGGPEFAKCYDCAPDKNSEHA